MSLLEDEKLADNFINIIDACLQNQDERLIFMFSR